MIKISIKKSWLLLAGMLLFNACSPDEPKKDFSSLRDTIPYQQDDDLSDNFLDDEFGPV